MGIFLYFGGQTHGPFLMQELQLLWNAGDIPADAVYWFEGMREWRTVSEFQPPPDAPLIRPKQVVLTTAFHVTGREVEAERDIVTAECVLGMNIFRDLIAGISDALGGRSDSMQVELRRARTTCLMELRTEAAEIGADAVIGMDLKYSEISGQGKSMLLLVATGTAVKLKPVPPPTAA